MEEATCCTDCTSRLCDYIVFYREQLASGCIGHFKAAFSQLFLFHDDHALRYFSECHGCLTMENNRQCWSIEDIGRLPDNLCRQGSLRLKCFSKSTECAFLRLRITERHRRTELTGDCWINDWSKSLWLQGTEPAAEWAMSVAGKHQPDIIERPASLLVPTWVSTALSFISEATAPAVTNVKLLVLIYCFSLCFSMA